MMAAGVPEQGPFAPPSLRHRATAPATWGDAMLVPEIRLLPPSFQVDLMHTPGAAIVWPLPADVAAKLEKLAYLSSDSPVVQVGARSAATGLPVAVRGGRHGQHLWKRGRRVGCRRVSKSQPLLPAATT